MVTLTKYGVALMAASNLTGSKNVQGIAATYVAWIDAKADEDLACNALIGASRSSKSPAAVIVRANALYTAIPIMDSGDDPTIVGALSPAVGSTAGGTAVTITGTHFIGTPTVTFGGTTATSIVRVSSTSVTCVTPAKTAGAYNVVLTFENGAVTKTNGFTYS